jgi:FkbM family methyltransferase
MRNVNRLGVDFLVHDDSNAEIANFWTIDSWEQSNYNLVKDFSGKCSTFVNAGGWIGPFTLFAAKLYEKVYSLEPDPLAYEELVKNIELNNFTNVNLGNKALFDGSKSEISMGSDFSPLGRSGTSIFQSDKAVKVPCTTLMEWFTTNNIPEKSFFILDVEGAEYVLFDDVEFYNKFKPIVLLELHSKFLNDEDFKRMKNAVNNLNHIYNFNPNNFDRYNINHYLLTPI